MYERASSFDLDGVVFERIPLQTQAVFKKYILRKDCFEPPDNIPEFKRKLENPSTRITHKIRDVFQQGRKVKPGAREFVRMTHEINGDDIFGNTGRKYRENCLDYTLESLNKGGLLGVFQGVFMAPEGVTNVESKAQALEQLTKHYQRVTHFDDDPTLIGKLAKIFPQVDFVLVQDLTSGILFSDEEMSAYPNVRRIACLDADSFMQFQESW